LFWQSSAADEGWSRSCGTGAGGRARHCQRRPQNKAELFRRRVWIKCRFAAGWAGDGAALCSPGITRGFKHLLLARPGWRPRRFPSGASPMASRILPFLKACPCN